MAHPEGASVQAPRPVRPVAQRNRAAILAAARETFENEGVFASLDRIAVRAGVGNATLYRNFPTRDDLLAALIQTSIDAALSEADELARSLGPRAALADWLFSLTWQLRIWHDLPNCIASAHDDPESSMNSASSALVARTAVLLEAAKSSGEANSDITADEVFELITAVSWGVDRFGDDKAAARRRVEIATAGIFT